MKKIKCIILILILLIGVFVFVRVEDKKLVEIPKAEEKIILTERENVENYLKDNINILSPVKAVLGGTWYVVSSTIDLEKKSGIVTYEDGHIQEKKNFTYTVNDKREVTNLTIK
ncbi:MAG: hypothetical protein WC264_00930 [Candidatus Paceibacterota bacterium]|jgi:hypothetical protein